MNTIDTLNPQVFKTPEIDTATQPSSTGFSDRLKSAMEDVNQRQHVSDQSMEQVVEGRLGIHEGMINISQADISLRLLTQVRNKAMGAYKEIMNMQF